MFAASMGVDDHGHKTNKRKKTKADKEKADKEGDIAPSQ